VTVDGATATTTLWADPSKRFSGGCAGAQSLEPFSAQLGRSGSSVINIVTKSGTNEFHGAGSFYYRSHSLQGLPATFDRGLGQTPPFDREQAAFAIGGPIKKDRLWFFGSFEYRNQDGAVLVGTRNLASRTIIKSFAAAPLNDLLSTNRVDWRPSDKDQVVSLFTQREDDVAPMTRIAQSVLPRNARQAPTILIPFLLITHAC
jgi:hypothetical protein